MQFRTEINISPAAEKINYESKIVFIGSCFAENIGNRLTTNYFQTDINPFGVLYNPISVLQSLQFLIQNRLFTPNDIQFYNERWFSFYHHSDFSDSNPESCLSKINSTIKSSSKFLQEADFLFITLGTAWTYELKSTNQIVSNCHKYPSHFFNRVFLETEQIVADYQAFIKELRRFNPKLKIIFTVSPIRHWKDGAVGNQVSKATLLVAVHRLCRLDNVSYFPAYEIVMDDLRDYRFYESDMIHPNSQAIDYIFEKFSQGYFDTTTMNLYSQIEKLVRASLHRPFNAESESFKTFKINNLEKIQRLKQAYSFLNLQPLEQIFAL